MRQGSGSPNCADNSIYTRAANYFGGLAAPAMFTPGDNDWTDCDPKGLGADGRNSLQELDNERAFFLLLLTLWVKTQFLQDVQATPPCKGFGSANDNLGPNSDTTKTQTATYTNVHCVTCATITPDPVEYAARNAAGIQWMKDTFATAVA